MSMKIDLMCESYKRAAANRQTIRLKQNISGYLEIEAIVRSWPYKKPLPNWITQGNLPKIGNTSNRAMHQGGFHEVIDERIDITAVRANMNNSFGDEWDGSWDNAVKIVEEQGY